MLGKNRENEKEREKILCEKQKSESVELRELFLNDLKKIYF